MVKNWKSILLCMGETIISREPGNSMVPKIKSRQPVRIEPCGWEDVSPGDIVYCKVKKNFYTHLVKSVGKRGCLICNNKGRINGWTKDVYGKVIDILPMDYHGPSREKKKD